MDGADDLKLSLYRRYLDREEGPFDPYKIGWYCDCFLETEKSFFRISSQGRIRTNPLRPDIENARVLLIGGIEPETYKEWHERLNLYEKPENLTREDIAVLIIRHGKRVREGRFLALILEHDDPGPGKMRGIVMLPVKDMYYVH